MSSLVVSGFKQDIVAFAMTEGHFVGKPFAIPGKTNHVVFVYIQERQKSFIVADYDLVVNRLIILKEMPLSKLSDKNCLSHSFIIITFFWLVMVLEKNSIW